MTKPNDSHSKSKSRHSKTNYTNRSPPDTFNYCKELLKSFKNEWKSTKSDLINTHDSRQTLQNIIADQKADIQTLQREITKRDEEAEKKLEEYMNLKNDLVSIKKDFLELQEKYAALEIPYDRNMTEKATLIERLQVEVEIQNEANKQLQAEFKQLQSDNNAKLLATSAELEKKDLYVKEMEFNAVQFKVTISEMQNEFEANKREINENFNRQLGDSQREYEEKITALREELKQHEELLQKYREENKNLEEANRKLIEEQKYRQRQIERAVAQPLSFIQPSTKSPEVFSTSPTDNDAKKHEFKHPNTEPRFNRARTMGQRRKPPQQPAAQPRQTAVNDLFDARPSVIKSSPNLQSGKYAIIRKVQMVAVGSTSKEDNSHQEQKQAQQPKRKTSIIAYAHSENDFSSDDDDDDVPIGHKDVIDDFINTDSSSGRRSFKSNERKRPTEPYQYVETSDSEPIEKHSKM